jgi:hypothetical protein
MLMTCYIYPSFFLYGVVYSTLQEKSQSCLFTDDERFLFVVLACFFVRVANLPEEVKKQLEDPDSRS